MSKGTVIRQVGVSGVGHAKREALANASLVALKEAVASSVQVGDSDLPLRSEWRGCMRFAQ